MVFSVVDWTYKEEATSTKLDQMVENLLVHDHRADGAQGAALVGDWVDCTGDVSPGAGWALTGGKVQRYRLLLGGALVEWDLSVTRTGAAVDGTGTATVNPGGIADATLLSGMPAAAEVLANEGRTINLGNALVNVTITADGRGLLMTHMGTEHHFGTGAVARFQAVLCRA